jgi:hypothetical protein
LGGVLLRGGIVAAAALLSKKVRVFLMLHFEFVILLLHLL